MPATKRKIEKVTSAEATNNQPKESERTKRRAIWNKNRENYLASTSSTVVAPAPMDLDNTIPPQPPVVNVPAAAAPVEIEEDINNAALENLNNLVVNHHPILLVPVAPVVQAAAPNLAGCGGQGPANPLFIPGNRVHLDQYRPQRNLLPNQNGVGHHANNPPQQQPQQPAVNPLNAGQNQPRGLGVAPAAAAGNTLFNLLLGTGIKKAVTGAATTLLTTGFGTAVTYMFGDSNEGTNNPKPGSRILPIGGGDKPVVEEETKPTPAPAKHECHVNDRLAGRCR